MGVLIQSSKLGRAGDQLESGELFTVDEVLQMDLFRQFWLYAVPPRNGEDLYSSPINFIPRAGISENGYLGRGLRGAKGLRANTKAVFNYVPYIVSQNRSMILNNAKVEGIKVNDPNGKLSEPLTTLAQKLIRPQFNRVLQKLVNNGLVTGDAYIWPKKTQGDPGGDILFDVLFSNSVFPTPTLNDIDNFDKIEIKYRVEDVNGAPYEFKQTVTKEKITTTETGKTTTDQRTVEYGLLPIIFIRNIEVPGEVHGVNCFFQAISDLDEINQLIGDCLRALALYGTPIGIVEGGAAPAGGLKLGVHSILELPQGVFKLLEFEKLDAQINNIVKIAEEVRKKCPEFDLADIQKAGGGDALSGHAIQLRLSTLIAKVRAEQRQYEEGLQKALQMALNLHFNNAAFINYEVMVDLGDVLPENLAEKVAVEKEKRLMGWTTNKLAMMKIGVPEGEIDAVEKDRDNTEMLAGEFMKATKEPRLFRTNDGKIVDENGNEKGEEDAE